MRNCQRPKLKQPVIALLINSQDNARKLQSKQSSQSTSKKSIKIIQTRSDNRDNLNSNRLPPSIKNLKSQKLIRNYEQKKQQLDQYGMRRQPHDYKSHKQIDNKYNQCLRDEEHQNQHQQIMTHYRRSKSRYKNAKQKAKKLIQNLRNGSKNYSTEQSEYQSQNQQYFKGAKQNEQKNYDKPSIAQQYEISMRSIGKSSSSSNFKEKKQKSSTIKWKKQQLSKMLKKSSLNTNQPKSIERNESQKTQTTKNQSKKQKSHDTTTLSNATSVSSNNMFVVGQNMVVKAKDLGKQYGIGNYSDKKKNNLESIAEIKKDQTLSHKMPTIQRNQRDSTDKILRRSRQKNNKIIKKLREKNILLRIPNYQQKLAPSKYNTFNTPQKYNSFMQESSMLGTSSNLLMLNSKLNKSQTYQNQQIKQKILIHLQALNMLGDYAQSFRSIYQDCQEWQELIFLLYKKYYIQRLKVFMIMKKGLIKFQDINPSQKQKRGDQANTQAESPFVFNFCKVSLQELNSFRQSKQEISLQLQVNKYNKSIKIALRQLYNQFIEKTSQNSFINMYEVDDFSQEIIEDLNEEINMLTQSSGKSRILKKRINLAVQIGLIVAHLGGYHIQEIQDIVTGQVDRTTYYNKYYQRFMNIFEQNQDSQN